MLDNHCSIPSPSDGEQNTTCFLWLNIAISKVWFWVRMNIGIALCATCVLISQDASFFVIHWRQTVYCLASSGWQGGAENAGLKFEGPDVRSGKCCTGMPKFGVLVWFSYVMDAAPGCPLMGNPVWRCWFDVIRASEYWVMRCLREWSGGCVALS